MLPCLFALFARRWRIAFLLIVALVGSYALQQGVLAIQPILLGDTNLPPGQLVGLYEATAVVLLPAMRWKAVTTVLEFTLPTLIALVYAAWKFRAVPIVRDGADVTRLALLVLASSWLAWYILLANSSIPRYLYPPVFLAAPFLGAMLSDLTNQFDARMTLKRAGQALRHFRFNAPSVRALFAIMLFALAVPFTLVILVWGFVFNSSDSARTVAEYLNTNTPANALIESYDPEIFFFLNRPYHYPPDQTHVDLIRRTMEPTTPIDYDPLIADPDFLVVGPFGAGWKLYDSILATDEFQLTRIDGEYKIYARKQ